MRSQHPFDPIYDKYSEILILGSFPSVKSREISFYYGHPQNRFWKVMSAVLCCAEPVGTPEKTDFLLSHRIALWDTVKSCEITGSSDASLKNVEVNDIGFLLARCPIRCIFANGRASENLYRKYVQPKTGLPVIGLPSTSPANAAASLPVLTERWRAAILPYLIDADA
jgi:hypoxanthine-DNA glycosylase